MRPTALDWLACTRCGASLALSPGATRSGGDDHIEDGALACTGCAARFAIQGGVPRLTPALAALDVDPTATATAERFGVQWQMFADRSRRYERQLCDWLAPLTPADFDGRAVLEGGCGKGRHTALVAAWGARAVVALDLGDAVDVAFAATRHLPAVHVVQGDLTRPPVRAGFDLGFSVGVLHHLPEPAAGFHALCDRIRPGGRVAIWVYGRESNEWIVRWVDPLRRTLTARMPERALYWASLPPSALLAAALRAYRDADRAARLPYGSYLHYISRFPLREIHNIVFDQLVTPIAHYLSEAEVRAWFSARDDVVEVEVSWHNRNSWRATARRA